KIVFVAIRKRRGPCLPRRRDSRQRPAIEEPSCCGSAPLCSGKESGVNDGGQCRKPPGDAMRLHCEFSTPVARTDLGDYFRHLRSREVTSHVLFLYGAVFHPAVHPCRQGILQAAFTLFGEESLAVTWKDTSGLSEADLADLGFCKITGSDLIFRHSALRTPFR